MIQSRLIRAPFVTVIGRSEYSPTIERHTFGCDETGDMWRISKVMKFARRLALLAALAVAVAAVVGGTTARSAPEAAKPRLITFGTCGQLLDYAKAQTKRFVGAADSAAVPGIADTAVPAPTAEGSARAASPVQGVDYSGTNVQEEGVDEPDLVKTNGKTLFTVANGSCAPSTSAACGRGCSTRSRSTGGWATSFCSTATGCS